MFASDGEAVDLKASGKVDGKSADLEIAVVADWGIVFADGGVVLDDVSQYARDLVADDGAGDGCDGEGSLLKRSAVEAGSCDSGCRGWT